MNRSKTTDSKQNASEDNRIYDAYFASDFLERDKQQSHRLHEPASIHSHTDPYSGNDVLGDEGHPTVVDGIVTIYFESPETRDAYLHMEINHPVSKISTLSTGDEDRGG